MALRRGLARSARHALAVINEDGYFFLGNGPSGIIGFTEASHAGFYFWKRGLYNLFYIFTIYVSVSFYSAFLYLIDVHADFI